MKSGLNSLPLGKKCPPDNFDNCVLGRVAPWSRSSLPLRLNSLRKGFLVPCFLSWRLVWFSFLQHRVFGEPFSGAFSELGFLCWDWSQLLMTFVEGLTNIVLYCIMKSTPWTFSQLYCNFMETDSLFETWTQKPHLGPELSRHFVVSVGTASCFFLLDIARLFWRTATTHCRRSCWPVSCPSFHVWICEPRWANQIFTLFLCLPLSTLSLGLGEPGRGQEWTEWLPPNDNKVM